MKAVLTITVPDAFLEQRCREVNAEYGPPSLSPGEFFRERLTSVAEDELPIALWLWPIEVTVAVES